MHWFSVAWVLSCSQRVKAGNKKARFDLQQRRQPNRQVERQAGIGRQRRWRYPREERQETAYDIWPRLCHQKSQTTDRGRVSTGGCIWHQSTEIHTHTDTHSHSNDWLVYPSCHQISNWEHIHGSFTSQRKAQPILFLFANFGYPIISIPISNIDFDLTKV